MGDEIAHMESVRRMSEPTELKINMGTHSIPQLQGGFNNEDLALDFFGQ